MNQVVYDISIGVVSTLIVAAGAWTITRVTNWFTNYTIVILHKPTWEAFKKVTPGLHDQFRTGKRK